MKKLLIASGCSFTDKDFYSVLHPEMDCSWPKWPELLAEKLDMECINLGHNGAGNEYIYSSLLEQILKEKIVHEREIGLVIPAWSQVQREDYQLGKEGLWRETRIQTLGDVFGWTRKSLRYFASLQLICKQLNVPCVQFQMLSLFDGWLAGLSKTNAQVYENRNNPNFVSRYRYPGKNVKIDNYKLIHLVLSWEKYIDTDKFLGWPALPNTHKKSYFMEYEVLRDGKKFLTELLVSDKDLHPNEKGHQKIAEFLYGQLG